jgi:hypothetical protein
MDDQREIAVCNAFRGTEYGLEIRGGLEPSSLR